jgi:hypothetical protein
MSIVDKLKGTKEKAILGALGPAMRLIDDWTKDIKPENEVAAFVEANLGTLFEQQGDKANTITPMLAKMAVAEANDNPEYVLHKMLRFYEALRVWYPEYQARDLS